MADLNVRKVFDRVLQIRVNIIGSVELASEHHKGTRYSKKYSKKNIIIKIVANQFVTDSIQITPSLPTTRPAQCGPCHIYTSSSRQYPHPTS